LHSRIPLVEMLTHLEKDHARVLVALLMYGTLTALEEGRTTVDTSELIVLNWPVMLYFRDNLKPLDHILVEAVSSSIEIDAVSCHRGLHMVPRCCREIKDKFAPWFAKYLGDAPVPPSSRSEKISLPTDVPLDRTLLDLEANHVQALVVLLMYGTLTALEEGLITPDVAERVVLNGRILLYCQGKLKPRDRVLESCLLRCIELEAISRTAGQEPVPRVWAEIKGALARTIGTATYLGQ